MHKAGVAHRDLKPWNVMLDDRLSSAKVIDFSYSTPLDLKELEGLPASKLLSGWLSGTPQFMAPEQNVRDKIPMTDDFSKMDIWALGQILIYMLKLSFSSDEGVGSPEGMRTH